MNLNFRLLIGRMDQKDYTLKMKEKVKENPTQMILSLLHEYGHAISQKRFKTADYRTSQQELIEEGMADTFADIVAHSFYEKNGIITINGQEINLYEATMLNYSGYKNHNNVVRTMLYPLEELGQDKEAIFHYYFDNKFKFFELTLGTEYIEKLPADFNKNPDFVDFSWSEIYNSHKDGYRIVDIDSVYAINNEKLNEFSKKYNIEMGSSEQEIQKGQNNIEEIIEIEDDLVDYYEKYGIGRDEEWQIIKEKLSKEHRKWLRRSSSTNEKEILDEVFQHIDEISEVLALFKPGNEEKRKQYDAKLDEQKQRQIINDNGDEKKINKKSKIGLIGIAASIRNNPTSLEHLREIQQQMASQIKAREKNRDSIKLKLANQTEIDDIEK